MIDLDRKSQSFNLLQIRELPAGCEILYADYKAQLAIAYSNTNTCDALSAFKLAPVAVKNLTSVFERDDGFHFDALFRRSACLAPNIRVEHWVNFAGSGNPDDRETRGSDIISTPKMAQNHKKFKSFNGYGRLT